MEEATAEGVYRGAAHSYLLSLFLNWPHFTQGKTEAQKGLVTNVPSYSRASIRTHTFLTPDPAHTIPQSPSPTPGDCAGMCVITVPRCQSLRPCELSRPLAPATSHPRPGTTPDSHPFPLRNQRACVQTAAPRPMLARSTLIGRIDCQSEKQEGGALEP